MATGSARCYIPLFSNSLEVVEVGRLVIPLFEGIHVLGQLCISCASALGSVTVGMDVITRD